MRTRASALRAVLALVLAASGAAGCHTMRFSVSPEAPVEEVYERKFFYLWGLTPTRIVDVSRHCEHGASAIVEETSFSDGFLAAITLGIVSPRSSWYHCAPGPEGAQ